MPNFLPIISLYLTIDPIPELTFLQSSIILFTTIHNKVKKVQFLTESAHNLFWRTHRDLRDPEPQSRSSNIAQRDMAREHSLIPAMQSHKTRLYSSGAIWGNDQRRPTPVQGMSRSQLRQLPCTACRTAIACSSCRCYRIDQRSPGCQPTSRTPP